MAFLDDYFQISRHVASLATGQAHDGEPHEKLDQNDLYGRVTQELLLEEDSESGESHTEELNQDGLDLEESAKEGKATKAFGDFESQGPREASFSEVLEAQNDDTGEEVVLHVKQLESACTAGYILKRRGVATHCYGGAAHLGRGSPITYGRTTVKRLLP